jgi:ribulose-5-phosphate 4-epimerase/fuculose-1-phosphate aldolase
MTTPGHALAVDLCRRLGALVPMWVQGAGGNVSVKEPAVGGPVLWIKASGIRLDAVTADRGIVGIPWVRLLAALAVPPHGDAESAYAAALAGAAAGLERPSMEAGMHAVLPRHLVIHAHSLPAVLMADEARREPAAFASWLRGHPGWRVARIEAVRPGLDLGRAVAKHADADVLLLEAHGVVLHLDDVAGVQGWAALEADWCRARGRDRLAGLLDAPVEAVRVAYPGPAPWRAWMPDIAVFGERLHRILRDAGDSLLALAPDAWDADRDAAELWLAVQVLHAERPDLPGLPGVVADAVGSLPTEAWRRRVGRPAGEG